MPIEGVLLWNRLLWFGLSFLLLALAYRLFKVEGKAQRPSGDNARADDPSSHGRSGSASLPAGPAALGRNCWH